ncbi:MAG: dihydroneopterin aldolase [Bacteroidales bacterium]|jgi:dihydroneopterin aldolase|nr:dihydroneopterin aldolase [Bacteroidales bacterium]
MKTSIKLNDMQFYAYHGVMAQETKVGNNYVVNICMDANLLHACQTDNVDDTISYALIYDLVKAQMVQPSKLLEHVAMRIYQSIRSAFPQITSLEVRLAKNNPPISGEVKSAEIIISE